MDALGVIAIILAVAGAYLLMTGGRVWGVALIVISIVLGLAYAGH